MELDLQEIRITYAKFEDWKIEKLATQDPASLHPGVLEILKEEIRVRGLNTGLLTSVETQSREITSDEMDTYIEMVRSQSCPLCNCRSAALNASVIASVKSFIFYTTYDKSVRVACKDCLDKEHGKAASSSGLLGWWAIPWGLIRTIQSFHFNSKRRKEYHENPISPTLVAFVAENRGKLEMAKVDIDELAYLLKEVNEQ